MKDRADDRNGSTTFGFTAGGCLQRIYGLRGFRANDGAHVRARTGDLFLTKEVLCQLSYVGPRGMPLGFRPGDADCAINAESAQPSVYLGKSAYWTDLVALSLVLVGREGIEPPQSLDG